MQKEIAYVEFGWYKCTNVTYYKNKQKGTENYKKEKNVKKSCH